MKFKKLSLFIISSFNLSLFCSISSQAKIEAITAQLPKFPNELKKIVTEYLVDKFELAHTFKTNSGVWSLAFSPRHKILAAGLDSGDIEIWRYSQDKFEHVQTLKKHAETIYSLDFSPDGIFLISGSSNIKSNKNNILNIWKL